MTQAGRILAAIAVLYRFIVAPLPPEGSVYLSLNQSTLTLFAAPLFLIFTISTALISFPKTTRTQTKSAQMLSPSGYLKLLPTRIIHLQIIGDYIFISFFFIFTNDQRSDIFLFFSLPTALTILTTPTKSIRISSGINLAAMLSVFHAISLNTATAPQAPQVTALEYFSKFAFFAPRIVALCSLSIAVGWLANRSLTLQNKMQTLLSLCKEIQSSINFQDFVRVLEANLEKLGFDYYQIWLSNATKQDKKLSSFYSRSRQGLLKEVKAFNAESSPAWRILNKRQHPICFVQKRIWKHLIQHSSSEFFVQLDTNDPCALEELRIHNEWVAIPLCEDRDVIGKITIYNDLSMAPILESDMHRLDYLCSVIKLKLKSLKFERTVIERYSEYESLVDTIPQFIFRKDTAGKLTFASAKYCDFLGIDRKDILGMTDFDLFPAELASLYRKDDELIMNELEPLSKREKHLNLRTGKTLTVEVVKTPLVSSSTGELTGIQGIFWDVTAQEKTDQQLKKAVKDLEALRDKLEERVYEETEAVRRTERQLKQAQSLAGFGSWELDTSRSKRPIEASDTLYKILEADIARRNDLTMSALRELVHQEDRAKWDKAFLYAELGEFPESIKLRFCMPNGTIKWLEGRFEDIETGGDGTLRQHIIGTVRDITDEVIARDKLVEQNRELQQLNDELRIRNAEIRAVAEIESNPHSILLETAHAMSSPLGAAKGNLTITNQAFQEIKRVQSQLCADSLQTVESAIAGLTANIARASTLGIKLRNYTNPKKPKFLDICIDDFVRSSCSELAGRLDKADMELLTCIEGAGAVCRIDTTEFQTCLENLIDNAIFETPPKGKLVVETMVVCVSEAELQRSVVQSGCISERDWAYRIRIIDAGSGVIESEVPELFKIFYTKKRTSDGMGFGLSEVKKVVEIHDGLVSLRNRSDGVKGAMAEVLLPVYN